MTGLLPYLLLGRAIEQLARQSRTNAEETTSLVENIEQQTKKLYALNKGMLRSRFHVEAKLKCLADNTVEAFNNLATTISENNSKLEAKIYTMMKGMKM